MGLRADPLSTQIYAELRTLAARQLRGERHGHTLQATALVHEAWMRLSQDSGVAALDPGQFRRQAARALRQVLVDHARRRARVRHGGAWGRVTLASEFPHPGANALDLLDLDDALHRLSALHPRQASAVELHYFGGLSVDEIAAALETSPRTVDGDLKVARAWLARELKPG